MKFSSNSLFKENQDSIEQEFIYLKEKQMFFRTDGACIIGAKSEKMFVPHVQTEEDFICSIEFLKMIESRGNDTYQVFYRNNNASAYFFYPKSNFDCKAKSLENKEDVRSMVSSRIFFYEICKSIDLDSECPLSPEFIPQSSTKTLDPRALVKCSKFLSRYSSVNSVILRDSGSSFTMYPKDKSCFAIILKTIQ
jgi:hypothetical protein